MSTSDRSNTILRGIDLLLAEQRRLVSAGPHFAIVHRFQEPETDCAPGEWITEVFFVYHGADSLVPLSPTLLMVFDYLACHHRSQSASEITAGMRGDPFYQKHAANATPGRKPVTRKISRSCIKAYIRQIRLALGKTFEGANVQLDPRRVLISEKTVTNHVRYGLKATYEWRHEPRPSRPMLRQICAGQELRSLVNVVASHTRSSRFRPMNQRNRML